MQFVAASKLRRAQESTLAARPYSEKIDEVLADVAAVLGPEDHPLLADPRGQEAAPDPDHHGPRPRRTAEHQRDPLRRPRDHRAPGRPGGRERWAQGPRRDAPRPGPDRGPLRGLRRQARFADVLPLARLITDDFLSGEYGRIDLVYSRFISTLSQKPILDTLLPIEPSEDTEGIPGNQFIFEPSPAAVLEQLLPRYVATRLFHAVLEAKASEESSRMVAMKNATENAGELIDDLTLAYNKVRQSNITREMIEIATGARAS